MWLVQHNYSNFSCKSCLQLKISRMDQLQNGHFLLVIEDQENVILATPLPEQQNANEDVEPHAHIGGGDITIDLHLL